MTALEKQQKKISVIIPVYNAEKYIRETLDSIIKQSYKNLEIILIMDQRTEVLILYRNMKQNTRRSI